MEKDKSKLGWIKLWRTIEDWEWYCDSNTFRLFIHLLIKANRCNKTWKGLEIQAGSLIVGRKKLSLSLGLSEQEIRTSLNKLKSTGDITIKSTNKYSIITICKFGDYQCISNDEQPTNQPTNQPTFNQQSTTTKEVISTVTYKVTTDITKKKKESDIEEALIKLSSIWFRNSETQKEGSRLLKELAEIHNIGEAVVRDFIQCGIDALAMVKDKEGLHHKGNRQRIQNPKKAFLKFASNRKKHLQL